MKKYSILLAFVFLVSVPIDAFACACCAERGFFLSRNSEFDKFLGDEIKKLGPSSATLYTDAAYPENIEGFGSDATEFKVSSPFGNGVWEYGLGDTDGKNGVISLVKPTRVSRLMFDNDPLNEKRTNVELTKIFTFKGKVRSLTGFLGAGESYDMSYELTLKGKGNGCTFASDFKSYFLKIEGLKAGYKLFGSVTEMEDPMMQKRGDNNGAGAAVAIPRP